MVFASFDDSLHLGVDDVEDRLDEVVFVAVQHIRKVTSHLWKLLVDGLMGNKNKGKDGIQNCAIQGKRMQRTYFTSLHFSSAARYGVCTLWKHLLHIGENYKCTYYNCIKCTK